MWFSEHNGGENRADRLSGTITEYSLTSPAGSPWGVALEPDGNIWFTDQSGRVGKITTGGVITRYVIPGAPTPHWITAGHDSNLWFTANSSIYRLTMSWSFTDSQPRQGLGESRTVRTETSGLRRIWATRLAGSRQTEQSRSSRFRRPRATRIPSFPVPKGNLVHRGFSRHRPHDTEWRAHRVSRAEQRSQHHVRR